MIPEATYSLLENELLNANRDVSLQDRFRALFTLKNIGDDRCVSIISKAFVDNSVLLKHELGYVLGQIGKVSALPTLIGILGNKNEHPMVRHEAAEAMGAIGDPSVIDLLRTYATDPSEDISVIETCQIAIDRITKTNNENDPDFTFLNSPPLLPFCSVDPAVPSQKITTFNDLLFLEKRLNDESNSLYDRYSAMFSLRNAGIVGEVSASLADAALKILCNSLMLDKSSALFRHELAFVLGQRHHPASVKALTQVLSRADEASMVRHECAEALGAIATDEAFQALKPYLDDPEDVVRESCMIALDILEYEQSNEFQYADGVSKSEKISPKAIKEMIREDLSGCNA